MTTPTGAPAAFDLRAPLPTGTTVLEASAGTGKTYTIAGLVTRYVAEGEARLDEMLVVTFGRAATSELRSRVRERFVLTRDALTDPPAARACADPVVAGLADAPDDVVAERRLRLATALAGFDAATVATTHEFCLQVLRGLGTAADLDPGTALVDGLDDLVTEVTDDLYLRFHAHTGTSTPVFDRRTALAIARAATGDREALLVPSDAEPGSPVDVRVRFAGQVRAEVERRARALRVMGFDALLLRVRDALADPESGRVARARLRARYRVVLVDEFQDTDPVQWEVLERAFAGHRTLVVIGDPKQAIYAFRGADVHAYLAASAAAGTRATLATNWRSDPRLLDGLATLFRGAALGDDRIMVRPVAAGHADPVLGPGPDCCPVRLRVMPPAGFRRWKGLPTVGPVRDAVADDVAREVLALLAEHRTVTPRTGGTGRPLQAGDVAVLVRKGSQAQLVRHALSAAGVPSVLTGTSSVFATSAARDWLVLLEALEQPHRTQRVRRLALTPLVGSTARDLDEGGDGATDALALTLPGWADVLATRGVAAMFSTAAEHGRLAERLLHRPDGERVLTDLRHVAETLHREALGSQLGLAGLLSWLRVRVEESAADADQERSRRLETDASAVQVLTVHTSKGLEFPVVLVPFGWDTFGGGQDERLPRAHDDAGRRVLHVGGRDAADYGDACARQDREDAGEELRLLYVAATRAVSRLVLWWAPTSNTPGGPLHRLLFCDHPAVEAPVGLPVPAHEVAVERLRALAAGGSGLAVEVVDRAPAPASAPAAPAGNAEALQAAAFERPLDLAWRRTSYTGITRVVHDAAPVGSEAQVAVKDDEPEPVAPVAASATAAAEQRLRAVPSPMADLPAGAEFGTLVHAVLEQADLSAGDLRSELLRVAAEHLRHRSALDPGALADALLPAVSTPLGPLAGGLRFRDVAPTDRLVELAFELPLAGGDDPSAQVRLGAVAALLDAHLPRGDRVAPYADLLRLPALAEQPLRGYLTGSLDVVVRLSGPRYLVLDHKTNRLADRDDPLTAWHYRPAALDAAVLQAHYPLQALLYCVALHRFLRWRQPGYHPERHLGGVLYLFLRGMAGDAVAPDAGSVPGVWDWRPPAALVVALSDLLAGRRP